MSFRLTCCAVVVLGLLAWPQAPVVFGQQYRLGGGQYGQQQQQQQQRTQQMQQMLPQQVSIDGTITDMAGGAIVVTDKSNMVWKVSVPADATKHVTGTAMIEYLQQSHAKLTVDFKAEFDDQGAIKEKVSELTLVSPAAEKAGMVADGDAANVPNNDAVGGAGGKSAKHGPASKSAAKSGMVHGTPHAGSYHVVGKLSDKGDKFFVQIHGMAHSVELPLADQVTIKVDMADLSQAAIGDSVTVSGTGTRPKVMVGPRNTAAAPGMVKATDVKITLAEPLAGAKKKGSSTKSASPSSKKAKDEAATPAGS